MAPNEIKTDEKNDGCKKEAREHDDLYDTGSLIPRSHPARILLQYNMQYIPKVIRAGVGFGSGTETVIRVNVKWM